MWGASVVLLPFIIEVGNPIDEFRLPKAKFMVLLAFIAGAAWVWRNIDTALGFAVALVGFSAYYSRTFYPIADLGYFAAALVVGMFARSPSRGDIRAFLKLLELSALVCAIYGLVQAAGLDPVLKLWGWAGHPRPTAFLGQHTLYGPFVVSGLMASLFLGRKFRPLILLAPIPFVDSSFTYLSLAVGLGVFSFYKLGTKITLAAAGVLVLFSLVAASLFPEKIEESLNDKGRYRLWKQAIHLGKIHPVSGYGFGSFKVAYPIFQDAEQRKAFGIKDEELPAEVKEFIKTAEIIKKDTGDRVFYTAHNEYVETFMSMGYPGLLAIILVVGSFFYSFYLSDKNPELYALCAIFCVFLANASGNFIFHLVPQALLPLWSFIALRTYTPLAWEEYERS
jgi:O-antigen ligase